MYAQMAQRVYEKIKAHATTIDIDCDFAEVEFSGFASFDGKEQPCHIYPTWVECFTFDERGEIVENNFRIDTLMAYIEELIRDLR